jgi:hypothetical protein
MTLTADRTVSSAAILCAAEPVRAARSHKHHQADKTCRR